MFDKNFLDKQKKETEKRRDIVQQEADISPEISTAVHTALPSLVYTPGAIKQPSRNISTCVWHTFLVGSHAVQYGVGRL